MPNTIQTQQSQVRIGSGSIIKALIIFIVGGALVFGIINRSLLFAQAQRLLTPAWQQTQAAQSLNLPWTPTLNPVITQTPLPTATPTITPTIAPTGTSTALLTAIPTVTLEPAVLALETPIGSTIQFIILRVNPGEALGQFATRYNTTEAAIRAVNFALPAVLYIDRILVIPIDITDTSGLPAFEAVEIQRGGMTIEALVVELGQLPFWSRIGLSWLQDRRERSQY